MGVASQSFTLWCSIATFLVSLPLSYVKKKGPVAFSLSTLRNMICAVLGCCGTEQDFYRRLGLGTVRNLLLSVGFQQLY